MRTLMFVVAIAATAPACLLDDANVSSTDKAVESHNRLAANRLAANRLAANRLAANRLAANSLSSTRLVALNETAQILEDEAGREVYAYIVSCALEFGVTIEKTGVIDSNTLAPAEGDYCGSAIGQPAGTCVFGGSVGLAPEWADKRLTNTGEGWVSACLLARVNAADPNNAVPVDISLRGRHPALAVSVTEQQTYQLQEGAFYGNVFTGAHQEIQWNACVGRDEATSESEGLADRDCTELNPVTGTTVCGFNYAGNCGDYTDNNISDSYACSGIDDAGNYTECYSGSKEQAGKFGGEKRYRQVITVWVSGEPDV